MVYVVSALKKCLITISLVIVLLRFYPFVSSVNPIRPSLDTVFFLVAVRLRGQLLADGRIITVSFPVDVKSRGQAKGNKGEISLSRL